MSWPWEKGGSEADVPESLRGKTPEQIASDLELAAKAGTESKDLKTQLQQKDAQLVTVNTELGQMKDQIKGLEVGQVDKGRGRNDPSPPTSVLEDEDKAFTERLGPLVTGVLSLAAQTAKMIAESRIRQKPAHARLLSRYQADVDKLYATVPAQYQQYPETYENVFNQVLGGHLEELMAEQAKAGGSLFVESATSDGRVLNTDDLHTKVELSQDELDLARKMHISPEAMLESKKQQHSAGGHITFERVN